MNKNKKSVLYRLGRIIIRLIIILILLFGLQLTILAFPHPIFSESASKGTISLYSDEPCETPLDEIASQVLHRLQASRLYDSTRNDKVFIFHSEGLFRFFARLSFLQPDLQGFNLSIFNNSYINVTRINRLAQQNGEIHRYSIAEGSIEHVIAHEIAHDYLVDFIGRSNWKSLPMWKREGYVEYVANIASITKDSLTTIFDRINKIDDIAIWGSGYNHAQKHYEAELLWEFLLDIKHFSILDIVSDTVTHENTYKELMSWYNKQIQN